MRQATFCRHLSPISVLLIDKESNSSGKNTHTQLSVSFLSEKHNMLYATYHQHFSPNSVLLTLELNYSGKNTHTQLSVTILLEKHETP